MTQNKLCGNMCSCGPLTIKQLKKNKGENLSMTKKSDLEKHARAEKDALDVMAMLAHELRNGFTINIGILNRLYKYWHLKQTP